MGRDRDIARFEGIWKRHYGDVLAYARRRASDQIALDIAAEVFTVAWRRLEDVPESPRIWLTGVARRVLANHRRAERRRGRLTDRLQEEAARTPQPPGPGESQHAVLRALTRLSAKEREALMLIAWEGLDAREAAQVIGCTSGAFRVRLHRARRRLAEELEMSAEQRRSLDAGPSPAPRRGG